MQAALRARLTDGDSMPIIRTDNGPQFVSRAFGELCEAEGITHERIPPKTPNMNAYIESFHATLERDLLTKEVFATFQEAFDAIDAYMDFTTTDVCTKVSVRGPQQHSCSGQAPTQHSWISTNGLSRSRERAQTDENQVILRPVLLL